MVNALQNEHVYKSMVNLPQEEHVLKWARFPVLTGLLSGHRQYTISHCKHLVYCMHFTTDWLVYSMHFTTDWLVYSMHFTTDWLVYSKHFTTDWLVYSMHFTTDWLVYFMHFTTDWFTACTLQQTDWFTACTLQQTDWFTACTLQQTDWFTPCTLQQTNWTCSSFPLMLSTWVNVKVIHTGIKLQSLVVPSILPSLKQICVRMHTNVKGTACKILSCKDSSLLWYYTKQNKFSAGFNKQLVAAYPIPSKSTHNCGLQWRCKSSALVSKCRGQQSPPLLLVWKKSVRYCPDVSQW